MVKLVLISVLPLFLLLLLLLADTTTNNWGCADASLMMGLGIGGLLLRQRTAKSSWSAFAKTDSFVSK